MAIELQAVKSGYWLAEKANSFPAIDIRTDLFTHLFCAFADLDRNTFKVIISDSKLDSISTFSALTKLKNSKIKTILSIGTRDGTDGEIFSQMVSDPDLRKSFILSSIRLARLYDFDGLDLSWLYPSKDSDMTNLGLLLKEWHSSVIGESQLQHRPQLLLVSTVYYLSSLPSLEPKANPLDYPIDSLKEHLDRMNLLAYDFYTPQSSPSKTGPSHAFQNITTSSSYGEFGISNWIKERQFPPEKIVLGVPFYGWAWHLLDPKKHDVFSPANGAASGPGISSDGHIDYGSIKGNLVGKVEYNKDYIVNYFYNDTTWIAFDGVHSLESKISLVKKNFSPRGYAAWHIGGDDADTLLLLQHQNPGSCCHRDNQDMYIGLAS